MDVLEQGAFPPGPPDPAKTVPVSLTMKQASPKLASSGSKRDLKELDHKTSAQAGLASLVPSSRSEGTSDYKDFLAPSPPLTRGQKTNKERREKEAASNICSGSQKRIDPFIKGHLPSLSN